MRFLSFCSGAEPTQRGAGGRAGLVCSQATARGPALPTPRRCSPPAAGPTGGRRSSRAPLTRPTAPPTAPVEGGERGQGMGHGSPFSILHYRTPHSLPLPHFSCRRAEGFDRGIDTTVRAVCGQGGPCCGPGRAGTASRWGSGAAASRQPAEMLSPGRRSDGLPPALREASFRAHAAHCRGPEEGCSDGGDEGEGGGSSDLPSYALGPSQPM